MARASADRASSVSPLPNTVVTQDRGQLDLLPRRWIIPGGNACIFRHSHPRESFPFCVMTCTNRALPSRDGGESVHNASIVAIKDEVAESHLRTQPAEKRLDALLPLRTHVDAVQRTGMLLPTVPSPSVAVSTDCAALNEILRHRATFGAIDISCRWHNNEVAPRAPACSTSSTTHSQRTSPNRTP